MDREFKYCWEIFPKFAFLKNLTAYRYADRVPVRGQKNFSSIFWEKKYFFIYWALKRYPPPSDISLRQPLQGSFKKRNTFYHWQIKDGSLKLIVLLEWYSVLFLLRKRAKLCWKKLQNTKIIKLSNTISTSLCD